MPVRHVQSQARPPMEERTEGGSGNLQVSRPPPQYRYAAARGGRSCRLWRACWVGGRAPRRRWRSATGTSETARIGTPLQHSIRAQREGAQKRVQ